MKRKLVVINCLLVILLLIFSIPGRVMAVEVNKVDNALSIESAGVLGENIDEIPVFITEINDVDSSQAATVKNTVTAYLDTQVAMRGQLNNNDTKSIDGDHLSYQLISEYNNDYTVMELAEEEKVDLFYHPIYKYSMIRGSQIIESGINLAYINIIKPTPTSSRSVTSDSDSEEYWESECEYFGSRNGYKFLYTETAYRIYTNYVTPGNVTPSFNWVSFATSVVGTVASMAAGSTNRVVQIAETVVSTILGSMEPALSVTYAQAAEGKIEVAIDGHIYTRTVFIQDKLDRFAGYAYYYIGGADQAKVYQLMKAMVPTSKRTSTTYEYTLYTGQSSKKTFNTPGFLPSREICDTYIEYYRMTGAYLTYEETIDPGSLVTSLTS